MPDTARSIPEDLRELIDEACEGLLNDQGLARLESRLRGNQAAMRAYLLAAHLYSDLRWLGLERQSLETVLGDVPAAACSTTSKPGLAAVVWRATERELRLSVLAATIAVCLLLATMAYIVVPMYQSMARRPVDPAPQVVAALIDTHQAVWAPQQRAAFRGAHLVAGQRMHLVSGVIELNYRTGVRVILEGPCEYVVASANSGTLQRGKLIAQVPDSATGFAVSTPTAKLVDLGTEFALAVAADGRTFVHVYQGKVRLDSLHTGQSAELTTGQQASVAVGGNARAGQSQALAQLGYMRNFLLAAPNRGFELVSTGERRPLVLPDGQFIRLSGTASPGLSPAGSPFMLDHWELLTGNPALVAVQNPVDDQFAGSSGDDDNVLLLGNQVKQHELATSINAKLIEGLRYTLQVDVGQRSDYDNRGYEVALFAGTTELRRIKSSDPGAAPIPVGSLTTIELQIDADDFPESIGQPLQIRLGSLQQSSTAAGQTAFDNVRLSSQPREANADEK